jgi:hypothetical protein
LYRNRAIARLRATGSRLLRWRLIHIHSRFIGEIYDASDSNQYDCDNSVNISFHIFLNYYNLGIFIPNMILPFKAVKRNVDIFIALMPALGIINI